MRSSADARLPGYGDSRERAFGITMRRCRGGSVRLLCAFRWCRCTGSARRLSSRVGQSVGVLERVLCRRLVGRDEQLFALEDALLAAHRGESRLVALGGEAGMGKTRLASELAERAQRLGWTVLWGACSEAELPVPYLPVVEALGNYLSIEGTARIGESLGGPGVSSRSCSRSLAWTSQRSLWAIRSRRSYACSRRLWGCWERSPATRVCC